jgi:Rieske Fe-S protein
MFLGYAVSASWVGLAAATGYGTLRYVAPGSSARIASGTVVLGPAVDFPLNSSRVVRFGDRPVLVVRDSHGAFHAVSATCPHLQCVVGYQPSRELIVCGCHEGTFALSGQNVAGPPPSPLATFPVGVIGDVVVLGSST